MASKLQIITELSGKTAHSITDNHVNWTAFLSTAACNYKYKFQEQLLIYAQKPGATACAPIELWNKLGRWVNKGAKGIALIDDTDNSLKLRHVFDVSDTNSRIERQIQSWEIAEQYEDSVIEALENSFGELQDKSNLVTALISTAHIAVEDNFSDYFSNLMDVRADSFLEELDELNVELLLKNALESSVSFILLTRCNIDTSKHINFEDFSPVFNFNTPETVSILGAATSDISEMALREIGETIKNLQRADKEKIHTFAEKQKNEYHNDTNKTERSFDYGTDLHQTGRLPSAESDTTRATENREIWNAAQNLSEKSKERNLRGNDDIGQTDGPSFGNRQNGNPASRTDNVANGAETRRDRTTKGERSDEMGRDDEQHQALRGGNSSERADLQLAYYDRETEDKSLPFFHSDKLIKEILKTTPHLKATKKEIVLFFEANEDKKSRIDYIKSIFNNDYTELIVGDENRVGYKTYQNVLHLWEGSYNSRTSQGYYDWGVITNYFEGMILLGELTDTMKPLPSASQQITFMDQAEKTDKSSAFSMSTMSGHYSQEIIDYDLQRGSGFESGKFRIYEQFSKNQSANQNERFLSNEYGTGGASPIISGTGISQWHDGKGITLSKGDEKLILSWSKVSKRIGELISADRYLSPKEKEFYPIYLQKQEEHSLQVEEEKIARDILSEAPTEKSEPKQDNASYSFQLGDKVFLGASEYEIISFDNETVRLFDSSYPLFNKEFPRADFDRMLRENPLNDHLKTVESAKEAPFILEDLEWQARKLSDDKAIPVGRIEFLSTGESIEYTNEEKFVSTIKDENFYGVPMAITVYQDAVTHKHIDTAWVNSLDPLPQGFQFEDYPITEVEQIPEILEIENQSITPTWEKPKRNSRVQSFDLHPEVQASNRFNFRIANDELGHGGAKEKFANNLDSIKLLKQLGDENRFATSTEQETLSKYVGFGGLSQAFDDKSGAWANEYTQLKALLDESEYSAARESTLTAFYTSPVVIRAMFKTIENMGFKEGNILEPSCGTGNFLGMLPDSMADSKLYGVELDSITGRIAQQLYQRSSIAVQGFEQTNLPDSFFDLAIGNVPFGQFKVADKRYDKHNFLIHDYFFAKTLDKVRPGGIVAFITSKGTLDKENPAVRKYIAQRADLLGAIRLPNNAFKANAGTEVTADIIFLQKRDRIIDIEPNWVHLSKDENGISMNSYFVDNPDMLMGEMAMESTQYGLDSTCKPYDGADLGTMLNDAIQSIHAEITELEFDELSDDEDKSIPADFNVRNFSYTLMDGKLYFRENSRMNLVDVSVTAENRIKGMLEIRDCVRSLIEYQTEDYSDNDIKFEQAKLNRLYEAFIKKYGLINSRANNMAFSEDSSYCLLCSLEVIDENGELARKADMFTKRTIKQHTTVTSVDTASEALALSIAEKACVDMGFMQSLTDKTQAELESELAGVIFRNPTLSTDNAPQYESADEYLSGNVREKLNIATQFANIQPELYSFNVQALKAVQPKDLSASEISVRLGATWLPPETIKEFIFELFGTPRYLRWDMNVHYSNLTSEWNIEGKSRDRTNIKANNTYGTNRINGYKIIEDTLNLKDVRIFDYVEDADGKKQQVLNKKETTIAQQKQELIKAQFAEWIWQDPERREMLCRLYNDKFNSQRPREYDGGHIKFSGINPEITLRPHQVI